MRKLDWRLYLMLVIGIGLSTSIFAYHTILDSIRPESPRAAYQPASGASLAKRQLPSKLTTLSYQPNCKAPTSQSDSDLCAQWSAVEAVYENNRLVRVGIIWSYFLGAAGILTTAIGTVFVYRSLSHNEEAISLSRQSLKESRELSVHELRAYVEVKSVAVRNVNSPQEPFGLTLTYENQGQTPAIDVYAQFRVQGEHAQSAFGIVISPPPKTDGGSIGRLAINVEENNTVMAKNEPPTGDVLGSIFDGNMVIFGHGWITYKDVFGFTRQTNFKWFLDQSCVVKGMGMQLFSDGNNAT